MDQIKKIFKKKYLELLNILQIRLRQKFMLIYNEKLSVCLNYPFTNKKSCSKITKKYFRKVYLINDFYLNIKIKPKIAILGLNPHCESNDNLMKTTKL